MLLLANILLIIAVFLLFLNLNKKTQEKFTNWMDSRIEKNKKLAELAEVQRISVLNYENWRSYSVILSEILREKYPELAPDYLYRYVAHDYQKLIFDCEPGIEWNVIGNQLRSKAELYLGQKIRTSTKNGLLTITKI